MLMRTQLAQVIKSDPSLLLSSECEYFVKEFSEERGVQKGDVEKSIRSTFQFCLSNWASYFDDVKEGAKDAMVLLGASRCSRALSLPANISYIVYLTELNRNLVGNYAKALEPIGLINLSGLKRSEIISSTELGDLYSDILLGKMDVIQKKLENSIQQLLHDGRMGSNFELLEKFETAFDIAKEAYPRNSLNYGIIDDFHDLFVLLSAAFRKGQYQDVKELTKKIYDALEISARTRREAESARLKPLIMEDTNERIGRGRVFRPVRPKS